ncbi:MAG: hypothetical protein RLY86_4135 [Pseudomonadota bacterium]|jgi:antitoxin VapB
MALNIKSAEAEQAVRRLVELTGESITEAVTRAARERAERLEAERLAKDEARRAEIMAIIRRIQAMPILDDRPEDEILGYNEIGTWD